MVFCSSPWLSTTSLISSFVLFLLVSVLCALLQFPLIYTSLSPTQPFPSSFLFLSCLSFVPESRWSFAYRREKKKHQLLVMSINNCAVTFSSSWTLWGKMGEGWLRTVTGRPGWACFRPLSVRSMLTSFSLSNKKDLMGILILWLKRREGRRKGAASAGG